jgi:hypothetical protein
MQSLHGKIKALRSVSRGWDEGCDEHSENLKSGVGRNPRDRTGQEEMIRMNQGEKGG